MSRMVRGTYTLYDTTSTSPSCGVAHDISVWPRTRSQNNTHTIRRHTYIHTHSHTHTYTCTYTHAHAHALSLTHTHTHTLTQHAYRLVLRHAYVMSHVMSHVKYKSRVIAIRHASHVNQRSVVFYESSQTKGNMTHSYCSFSSVEIFDKRGRDTSTQKVSIF